MRYLIDTNVFINIVEEEYISNDVRAIIEDYENNVYISAESIKEYIHLVQNRKVVPRKDMRTLDVFDFIENTLSFNVKYVAKEHLLTLAGLPLVEGHTDPSDRLIISQAMTEKIPLISSDREFPKYRKFGLNFISNR